MKAILYSRVSTEKQSKYGFSLENQASRLKKYAREQGYDQIVEITDAGLSGRNSNRPGFQELIRMVKNREVDSVIVYSLSRFARNTIEAMKTIELFNRYNVSFISLSENFLNTTTAMGKFFVTNLFSLSQFESDQLGERISSVLQYKKQNGYRVGQIPFGYKINKNNKLIKDVKEQNTIKLIISLRKQGLTFQEIAEQLVLKGRKNKAGKTKWFKSQVYQICRASI